MEKILDKKFGRRGFLKAAAAGVAAAALAPSILGDMRHAHAEVRNFPVKSATWSEVKKMPPQQMAESTKLYQPCFDYLMDKAKNLKDSNLRKIAVDGLKNPVSRVLERVPSKSDKQKVYNKLLDAGYIKSSDTLEGVFPPDKGVGKAPASFEAAPGGGWGGHHAYPGGLSEHVATDLQTALAIEEIHQQAYGYSKDVETLTAAILLHDNTKPWIFQWKKDNSLLPETKIAGTGCHHVQAIADVMYRGLDPKLVVALADSHTPPRPGKEEAQVVGWIKAAAIIAGVDASKYLGPTGETIPLPRRAEGFLVNLGDGDWVLTGPVNVATNDVLKKIAKKVYKMSDKDLAGKPFFTLRDYLFSQRSDMALFQIWCDQGEDALEAEVKKIVKPE